MPGGDPNGWYPDLWGWLIEAQGVRSIIDVGCGSGDTVDFFDAQGCDAIGIEGIPQQHPRVIEHDYTLGEYAPQGRWDLAWSCEFVEHVEERFLPNFLGTFAAADLVLMTHAVPGQRGYHHVNCRDDDYWIAQLATIGHVYDAGLTKTTRALTHGYFARAGLAFRRSEA